MATSSLIFETTPQSATQLHQQHHRHHLLHNHFILHHPRSSITAGIFVFIMNDHHLHLHYLRSPQALPPRQPSPMTTVSTTSTISCAIYKLTPNLKWYSAFVQPRGHAIPTPCHHLHAFINLTIFIISTPLTHAPLSSLRLPHHLLPATPPPWASRGVPTAGNREQPPFHHHAMFMHPSTTAPLRRNGRKGKTGGQESEGCHKKNI